MCQRHPQPANDTGYRDQIHFLSRDWYYLRQIDVSILTGTNTRSSGAPFIFRTSSFFGMLPQFLGGLWSLKWSAGKMSESNARTPHHIAIARGKELVALGGKMEAMKWQYRLRSLPTIRPAIDRPVHVCSSAAGTHFKHTNIHPTTPDWSLKGVELRMSQWIRAVATPKGTWRKHA